MLDAITALVPGVRLAYSPGLRARWWQSLTFGGCVTLVTWIPLANLFLLPGAASAGVLMWDQQYRGLPGSAAS